VTRLVTQDLHTYCDHAHAHAVQSISGRNQAAQQLKQMQSESTGSGHERLVLTRGRPDCSHRWTKGR